MLHTLSEMFLNIFTLINIVTLSDTRFLYFGRVIRYPKPYSQVPMCVVAPGKQPRTQAEKALSTSSGHIIHLMPGDNQYDPASFSIVIVWNGIHHYIPSFIMRQSSILQYRCSVISRCLATATSLFSDIESDLDESHDEDLIEHFHQLRDDTILANHLLALRGLETQKLPPSTAGPDPRDTTSHLTRKTPLPMHPQPLIAHALQHPLDPDNVAKITHPTPFVPSLPEKIEQKDFDITPSDYETDKPRCIKTAGLKAPGRLIHTQKLLHVSIPYPLDPAEGHPPAKPDSTGAQRFKQGYKGPPKQSELLDIVQDIPYGQGKHDENVNKSRITQDTEKSPDTADSDKSRIAQDTEKPAKSDKPRITQDTKETVVEIPDDEEGVSSAKPLPPVPPPPSRITQPKITSETIEEITVEGDFEEESQSEQRKIKALKRKHLPSRKSPRIRLPKLDLGKGVKTALASKQKTAVENLAEGLLSNIVQQKPVKPVDNKGKTSGVSSSVSSQASGRQRQRTVIEMYAQAARRIAQTSTSSASQRSSSEVSPGEMPPPAPPQHQITQSQPPRPPPQHRITQSQAPPHQKRRITQSLPAHQKRRITHDPPQKRITQTSAQRSQRSDPRGGAVLKCTYCKYSTLRKESMTDHMRMHTGEKIKCDFCDKDYFSPKSLKNHIKFNHLKIDRCLCTQLGCSWSGKDYGCRVVHLYEEHGIGPAPICDHPDCRTRGHFSNYRTLERHRETFHKDKDLQCPHCDKKYKDPGNLANHIGVAHRGLPAFQCEICGAFYSSKKSLAGHQKEHEK